MSEGRGAMDDSLAALTLAATGARSIEGTEVVQELWSGYGEIVRCHLVGSVRPSAIVKHVRWPTQAQHPRGWNSDLSHRRKVKSYQVETAWYENHAPRCTARSRVPECLAVHSRGDEVLMVLEDLNSVGFPQRRGRVTQAELRACLSWLANFHATFMGRAPQGLWPTGTYWHLETRPDELAALSDSALREAAPTIDRALTDCPYQTFVHGDAKLANFCFSADGRGVAAVDFQYVGGGCGMKDVAYFVSSCLDEQESEKMESIVLDFYFDRLREALTRAQSTLDLDDVEQKWRALYPVAWTDFFRFLQGWSPGHWKIHRYSQRLAREVLGTL